MACVYYSQTVVLCLETVKLTVMDLQKQKISSKIRTHALQKSKDFSFVYIISHHFKHTVYTFYTHLPRFDAEQGRGHQQ